MSARGAASQAGSRRQKPSCRYHDILYRRAYRNNRSLERSGRGGQAWYCTREAPAPRLKSDDNIEGLKRHHRRKSMSKEADMKSSMLGTEIGITLAGFLQLMLSGISTYRKFRILRVAIDAHRHD